MKTIYVKFEVDGCVSYQDAERKVEDSFTAMEEVLSRLGLELIPNVLKTRKIVNKVHM